MFCMRFFLETVNRRPSPPFLQICVHTAPLPHKYVKILKINLTTSNPTCAFVAVELQTCKPEQASQKYLSEFS